MNFTDDWSCSELKSIYQSIDSDFRKKKLKKRGWNYYRKNSLHPLFRRPRKKEGEGFSDTLLKCCFFVSIGSGKCLLKEVCKSYPVNPALNMKLMILIFPYEFLCRCSITFIIPIYIMPVDVRGVTHFGCHITTAVYEVEILRHSSTVKECTFNRRLCT